MLSVPYALLHMEGVLRLVLQRGAWRDYLDVSDRGFWMSFTAMLWAAPVQIWVLMSEPEIFRSIAEAQDQVFEVPSLGTYVAAGMTRYVLAWILFPIVMFYLVRLLDAAERYVPFIVVTHWASLVLVVGILVPQTFLVNMGLIGPGLWLLLEFSLLLFQIWLLWFIASEVLEIGKSQAFAVVFVDLMLMLVVIPAFVSVF